MPRIILEGQYLPGQLSVLTRKAEQRITSTEGRAGMGYARDLLELQQRASKPLEIVGRMPFVSGSLLAGVSFPGIRGRVAAVSGADLTLFDPGTARNFAAYAAASPAPNATVHASASDGTGGTLRSGSVQIASIVAGNTSATLVSGSGNWTTAIAGLSVGDYLYGDGDFGPPLKVIGANGNWNGLFSGPATAVYPALPRNIPSGVFVLRSEPQPAVVTWLETLDPRRVNLASRYACRADLWIF